LPIWSTFLFNYLLRLLPTSLRRKTGGVNSAVVKGLSSCSRDFKRKRHRSKTIFFGLQSGCGSWQDEGMANYAKSKKNPAAVALGRLGGLRGGPARAKTLTAAERKTSARKAALARWAKKKK
jgi:hypothetical protein